VIKADFRGNTAQTINRCGEAIIRDLIKQAKESTDSEFILHPSSPTISSKSVF
jgi:hypothetical protein